MRNLALYVCATLLLCSSAAQAEDFYIELGRAASEDEARSAWTALKETNAFLVDYDVYPNKIAGFDGSFTYRVQAGPMLDKREASRVCRKLFRKQIPCFVIEGFDPKNAPSFADAAPALEKEAPLQLPWTMAKKESPEQAVSSGSEGRVEVAEAIPVALTEEDNQVSVSAPVAVAEAPSVEANTNVFSAWFKRLGWLSVQPFLDEARAQKFWKTLKKKAPDATAPYSVQVIHPVVSHDIPKVILSIGSFESEDVAMQFCRSYVVASELECQFSSEPPEGEQASGIVPQKIASDEYSLFWAEILSNKNQDKLLEKWDRIRTDNDDILSDDRSQITSSLSKADIYVVRIGPIKTRNKASKLCNTLQKRGVGCKLVSL